MQKVPSITRLVRWFCKQLNFDELLVAANILLEIINGKRDDIELRTNFHEEHPNYRQFVVDPLAPFTTPQLKKVLPEADFKQIMKEHHLLTGNEIKPVKRHKHSHLPPSYARCKHCNAPAKFLYVNDGCKKSQLRCKVCDTLFQSNCIRKESKAKYWCPHCERALYRWKSVDTHTIYKCGNKTCLCYLNNLEKLNEHEKKLQKTGMSSQFKLCYQYREYHFTPAELQTVRPRDTSWSLNSIHNSYNTVGLVLAYSISYGISARMTKQILRDVHNISISHQTVLNYLQNASVLIWNFIQKYQGMVSDSQIIGDETYIRITDKWGYTWFVIGAQSKALWAFNISDNRGVLPALSTLSKVMQNVPDSSSIEFIADGNPSYDAAVHAFNATSDNKSLSRIKVIGLSNDDDETKKYRHLKQLIERLNRTYKFHTRARCGFKNINGAAVLTILFVAYYNFLRPHTSLKSEPPIFIDQLNDISSIQGKWLKMLELAA
ncbi:MAG: DDE-type integrase/transposase/recombinase [Candidatus Heimdallarchaeota archaeon]|nr:DDE-type integrase/transposase/recombinase [Candidatus Heimdallarchaeota archaeon]